MDSKAAAFMIPLALVIFGIVYYYFTTRHRERMALIAHDLPGDYFHEKVPTWRFLLLLSLNCMGTALGVLIGGYLESLEIKAVQGFLLPSSVFFFLGLSFLSSYWLLTKISKKPH